MLFLGAGDGLAALVPKSEFDCPPDEAGPDVLPAPVLVVGLLNKEPVPRADGGVDLIANLEKFSSSGGLPNNPVPGCAFEVLATVGNTKIGCVVVASLALATPLARRSAFLNTGASERSCAGVFRRG